MPIQLIAVALDSSDEAIIALEQAMPLARRYGAKIALLHAGEVYEPPGDARWLSSAAAEQWSEILRERHKDARERVSEIRERYSGQGVELSQSFIAGFADKGITSAAAELGADLIVTGTHGRTGFQRLMMGSVAERIVRMSVGDVLVARRESAGRGFKRLLVASDFSDTSKIAVQRAFDLVEDGGEVRIVNCWQYPYAPGELGVPPELLGEMRRASEEALAKVAEQFQHGPVKVDTECLVGEPAHELARISAGYDLMVMGSHGRRGFRRFILGSVAEKTLRKAACSVYIARANEQ